MNVQLLLLLFSLHQSQGKQLFEQHCVKCHGTDGTKGKWGAKNLRESKLSDDEIVTRISDGKRIMPSWKKTLTEDEIKSVRDYVKTLR